MEKKRKTIDNFIINANKNLIPRAIELDKKQENMFQNLFTKLDNYISS